jgi:transposase, IS6 family
MPLTRRTVLPIAAHSAFAGFRFPPEAIVLALRWYLRFGLSYRDVEELLAERGIEMDHVTVHRWVRRFTPLLADAVRFGRHRVGDRWQVDETYIKVAGRWVYLHRAVDQFGAGHPSNNRLEAPTDPEQGATTCRTSTNRGRIPERNPYPRTRR